jgi:chorismate-pyruvate lyase
MNPAAIRPLQAETSSIAYPLDEFYARSGLTLPPLEQVDGEAVPEPCKTLLVHERDMTSTLENFHQAGIHLRLVSRERRGDEYFREVVLVLDGSEKPVEFGAIKISLNLFPEPAREQILAERWPLGHILKDHSIPYASQPSAFLRLASDPLINSLLNLSGAQVLYGRRNTLFAPSGESLAEIVEILPPTLTPGSTGPGKTQYE